MFLARVTSTPPRADAIYGFPTEAARDEWAADVEATSAMGGLGLHNVRVITSRLRDPADLDLMSPDAWGETEGDDA